VQRATAGDEKDRVEEEGAFHEGAVSIASFFSRPRATAETTTVRCLVLVVYLFTAGIVLLDLQSTVDKDIIVITINIIRGNAL